MVDANANVLHMGTDTQVDAHSDLYLAFAEMIIALMDGKLITKLRFPQAVVILFLIAKFCVCPATKRPKVTVDIDLKSKNYRKEFGDV